MYVTLRRYIDKGGLLGKLVPPVRGRFVPLLKQAPGFRGYCASASEDGHVVSVSVFEDRSSADAANDEARRWVGSDLRVCTRNNPTICVGDST
jgi:hypothetical protein